MVKGLKNLVLGNCVPRPVSSRQEPAGTEGCPLSCAQVLLVISGGAIGGSLPIMFAVYFVFVQGWIRSVHKLSDVNNYGHQHPTGCV